PKIFDRFHRVAGTSGRTQEGSGIGLSLVKELAALHGGRVSVTSALGRGTTFRVEIPKGYAHLPPDAIAAERTIAPIGHDAAATAAEAARWARAETDAQPPRPESRSLPDGAPSERACVLVVDDNADLRDYLSTLLTPHYDVLTADDGLAALREVSRRMPDLVVR